MDTTRSNSWAVGLVIAIAITALVTWYIVSSTHRHAVGVMSVVLPPALAVGLVASWLFRRGAARS